MNSTSSKVTISAAAGALTAIIVWILGINHIQVPAETAAAGTVLVTFLVGFFVTETAQPKQKAATMINAQGDTVNGTIDSTPNPSASGTPTEIPTTTGNPATVEPANAPVDTTSAPAEISPVVPPSTMDVTNTNTETVTTLNTGNVVINGVEYTPTLTVQ